MTYTKSETAKRLGISIKTLERAMNAGAIGYYRITREPTFGDQHIEEFLASKEVRPKQRKRA